MSTIIQKTVNKKNVNENLRSRVSARKILMITKNGKKNSNS